MPPVNSLTFKTMDLQLFLKLNREGKLPIDFYPSTLRVFIHQHSYQRQDIIRFVEFLANNPQGVQRAISCLSKLERKSLVRYLRKLRNYSPSCYILFHTTNRLELIGYDIREVMFWMAMKMNPLPVYMSGRSTRNWAVLQLNYMTPVPGKWTVQRTVNYHTFLASKLTRWYYSRWNSFIDLYNYVYDGDLQLVQNRTNSWELSPSEKYFKQTFGPKLNDLHLSYKINASIMCKDNVSSYVTYRRVEEAFANYDGSYNNSIALLKQDIKLVSIQFQTTSKTYVAPQKLFEIN